MDFMVSPGQETGNYNWWPNRAWDAYHVVENETTEEVESRRLIASY